MCPGRVCRNAQLTRPLRLAPPLRCAHWHRGSATGTEPACYYTAGQGERRHDYATIPAALADIDTRYPGAVIVFQFGGPERAEEFRQFDGPVTVTSSLDGAP